MKIKYLFVLVLCLVATTLSGCGSDNGGGEVTTPPPVDLQIVTLTGGVLKLSTAGQSSLAIGSVDVVVNLPAGVTVSADPATGEVASGAIAISGVAATGSNSLLMARFTTASGSPPAQLRVAVVNSTGFGVGEFVTIQFNLAAGTALPAADAFSIASSTATALDGSALGGVTAAPLSVAAQ